MEANAIVGIVSAYFLIGGFLGLCGLIEFRFGYMFLLWPVVLIIEAYKVLREHIASE